MISWPSMNQLVEWVLGWHQTFFPNDDRSEGSDAWREAQGLASLGGVLLSRAKMIYGAIFPTTAEKEDLDTHAAVSLPSDKRRQAASGTTAGDVKFTGTLGTPIPNGTELVDGTGNTYRTTEAVAAGDWLAGPPAYAIADVASTSTGQSCNKGAGEALTLVVPISGLDDEATVNTALSGARDQELDDELRARLLSWLQNPPGGGNWAHYKAFAEGVGSCVAAYVYPLYRGLGTVDVVCLGPGIDDDNPTGDRFAADEDLVWDYLDEEMRPCTADLGTRPSLGGTGVGVPVAQAQDVGVWIYAAPGYDPDWTGAFTVTALDATKKILTVTADPTLVVGLAPGDRVLFNVQVGGVWIPCIREIQSLTSGPPHLITVTEAFPSVTFDPTASGLVPAGPGTQDQVDALLTVFDDLTPGDTTPATRRPEPSPEHPTDLTLYALLCSLSDLASVLNAVVATPGADVAPAAAKNLIRNGRVWIVYV